MELQMQSESIARIYNLAEHVELRDSGWWQEAIDRTLLFELFSAPPAGLSAKSLIARAVKTLGAPSDRQLMIQRLGILVDTGATLEDDGKFFLTEGTRCELEVQNQQANELESSCRTRFSEALRSCNVSAAANWDEFRNSLLIPLTSELGARTLGLLRGDASFSDTQAASDYLNTVPETDRVAMEGAIVVFLDPTDSAVRKYLLGHLTHYMLVSSSALDRQTLTSLKESRGAIPTFNIVVDTNVIFSFLDLHRNPLNDAASSLLGLVDSTREYANIQFFVLQESLEEARHALEGARDAAPSGRVTRNLARAAAGHHISGLVGRYFEVAAGDKAMSPAAYFDPYIDGLEFFLAEMGIQTVSDDLSSLRARPSVKSRVDDWNSFQYDRVDGRPRWKIEHDVLALEYVSEKRGRPVAHLADAEWWFVTADLWLQRQEKRGLIGNRAVPKCINPAELVQLLRFWVPRSNEMEQALLGAIRLPFSFYTYDRRAERVAVRILDRLSGYANVEDFGVDTIEQLLSDKALRDALTNRDDQEDAIPELVDEAVNRIAELNAQRVAQLESDNALLQGQLSQQRKASVLSDRKAEGKEESKRNRLEKIARLESDLAKEREARAQEHGQDRARYDQLESTLRRLESDGRDKDAQIRGLQSKMNWALFSLVEIVLAVIVSAAVWKTLEVLGSLGSQVWIRMTIAVVAISLWFLCGRLTLGALGLKDEPFGRWWQGAHKTVWGWVGAGVVAVAFTFAIAPPPLQ